MVIYVDELLVLNGLSTWLLLLCVRGFLQLKPTRKRLLLGSVVGALSSLSLPAAGHAKGAGTFLPDFERGAHRRGGFFGAGETGLLAGDGVFTLVQLFVRRGDGVYRPVVYRAGHPAARGRLLHAVFHGGTYPAVRRVLCRADHTGRCKGKALAGGRIVPGDRVWRAQKRRGDRPGGYRLPVI